MRFKSVCMILERMNDPFSVMPRNYNNCSRSSIENGSKLWQYASSGPGRRMRGFSPSRLLGKLSEFTIKSFVSILEINDP